jgi:hypothetical protein
MLVSVKRRYLLLFSGALVLALLIPTVVSACPLCNQIDDPIARGFNWGILFLMAMPFTVFGLIGGGAVYIYRRANQVDNQDARSDADHEKHNE